MKNNKFIFATQRIRLQWLLVEILMVNVCVEVAGKKEFHNNMTSNMGRHLFHK